MQKAQVQEVAKRDVQLEYAFDYGVNLAARRIMICEDITDETFARVSIALTELEMLNKRSITIEINSAGGEVYAALGIVGRIKNSPCTIITLGFGHIMSAATAILAAGDVRKMSKYAWFLHHQASARISGKVAHIIEEAMQYNKEEQQWYELMQDLTQTPKETWAELGAKETHLTAEQCLQLGIVDKII